MDAESSTVIDNFWNNMSRIHHSYFESWGVQRGLTGPALGLDRKPPGTSGHIAGGRFLGKKEKYESHSIVISRGSRWQPWRGSGSEDVRKLWADNGRVGQNLRMAQKRYERLKILYIWYITSRIIFLWADGHDGDRACYPGLSSHHALAGPFQKYDGLLGHCFPSLPVWRRLFHTLSHTHTGLWSWVTAAWKLTVHLHKHHLLLKY